MNKDRFDLILGAIPPPPLRHEQHISLLSYSSGEMDTEIKIKTHSNLNPSPFPPLVHASHYTQLILIIKTTCKRNLKQLKTVYWESIPTKESAQPQKNQYSATPRPAQQG